MILNLCRAILAIILTYAVMAATLILLGLSSPGCVSGNELGTIKRELQNKADLDIVDSQIGILTQRTEQIEQKSEINAEQIGKVLSQTQKGLLNLQSNGGGWAVASLGLVLIFFVIMIKMFLKSRRLHSMLYDVTNSVFEASTEAQTEIKKNMKRKNNMEQVREFCQLHGHRA